MLRRVLTVDDVERILCGETTVDMRSWEKCASYEDGHSEDLPPVIWF